jgi:glycosyltransferase
MTISDTIESVLSQTYENIEYIVIDATSTDGSLDIIKRYEDRITIFISERDNGIYEGLNKGMLLATGDVVGFLNSDDLFKDKYVISKIVKAFEENRVDSIYGDLVYISRSDPTAIVRYWKSYSFSIKKLQCGWMPPHPTFYAKREVYEKYGLFNTDFKIAADYDLILRLLGRAKISTHYIPEVLVKMRSGGESNKSLKNLIKKSREDLQAMHLNGIGNLFSLFMKNISKIPQFFKKGVAL